MSEIVELRTESAKTFNLGSGKRQLIASPSPIHYKNSEGDWKDLSTDIIVNTVDRTIYSAKLLTSEIGYEVTNKSDSKKATVKLISIGGTIPKYSMPIISGNEAKWINIVPNVDLMIIFYESKIRSWRLLKTSTAPKKIKWNVEEDEFLGDMIFINDMWGIDGAGLESISSRIKIKSVITNGKSISEYEDTFDNKVIFRDLKTRVKSESTKVTYPVLIDADVNVKPTVSGDDGHVTKSASGLSIMNGVSTAKVRHWSYYGSPVGERSWARFPNITIPQSATINTATLKLYATTGTQNPIISILGKDLNNPAAPTTVNQGWSPATLASNIYTKTLASTIGAYINFDVKSIVQELVDTFDYSNEAMLFFIKSKIAVGNVNKRLFIKQYDSGTSSQYPNLVINYSVAGGVNIDDEGNNYII